MDIPKSSGRKRVPQLQKSLGVLLASFQGMHILIELKNDSEISGILEEADRGMNMVLHEARQVSRDGTVLLMDIAFVNGPKIRYVHIPSDINISKHMTQYMKKMDRISGSNTRHKISDKKSSTMEETQSHYLPPKKESSEQIEE
mmetsp:Transcript_17595/g.17668  ORF Transcript_17595/g.17668 Transcript_17595/m.17668 type:complete len:144 (-) Transcript_17595:341-772(-)